MTTPGGRGTGRMGGAGTAAWATAEGTARQAAPWVKPAARIGFGALGLVYVIVGLLAARTGLGRGGGVGDSSDALGTIVGQPFGRVLLGIVAFGLFGYMLWRIIEAVTDAEGRGTDAKGLAIRVGSVLRALIYGALGVEAARLAAGAAQGGGSGSGGESAEHWTARLLALPAGRWLVVAAGLGIAAYAIYQLYRAFSDKVEKRLDLHELGPTGATWAVRAGRIGITARAVVFGVIAWLAVQAGLDSRAEEAGGMSDALATLGERPWLLVLIGLGLIAYGLYQFVNARYRRLNG